ncbi:DUF2076 domain-containing protein [Marinomonas flavescens]|uniref:DUF2076 domain-containing protein n=1 Tax=Marinomonas flavescens TaxID=2529379 RepID=UPI0010563711|nr:DUF2076 domain-containing protein [Marinomonas flavescens]
MSDDAGRLIDQLFERVKEAEKQTGERDPQAESQINKHLVQQPSAPYYMAQTIIMQEAALKRLNARVEHLERAQAEKPSSGGFLSGLFGGGAHNNGQSNGQSNRQSGWGSRGTQQNSQGFSQNQSYAQGQSTQGQSSQGQPNQGYAANGGNRSFLGGALQTAAGVAGGVVVGSMLMNMFGHHTPTEMVDVIQEDPTGQAGMGQDYNSDGMGQGDAGQGDFANNDFDSGSADQGGFGQAGFDQNNGFDSGSADQGGFGQAGFDQNNGFGQSGFDQGGFADNSMDQGGFDNMGGGFDDFGGGFDDDFNV